MRIRRLFLLVLAAAVSFLASAQITTNDLDPEFGARIGATVDKKIVRGLHVSLSGEGRLTDNFSSFSRVDAGLGLSYKINDNFRVGGGYLFIYRLSSSEEWKNRHRIYTEATGTLNAGYWRFSLRERLQLTHKDVKAYKHQTTPNSLALKSRLKVQYRGLAGGLTPYCYVELRNVFNDPACSAIWSTASQAFSDYTFTGYTDAYINRVRGSLGAEWKIDSHNAFDFYLLADWFHDKNVDTGKNGTVLKSISYDRGFRGALCIGYEFSF